MTVTKRKRIPTIKPFYRCSVKANEKLYHISGKNYYIKFAGENTVIYIQENDFYRLKDNMVIDEQDTKTVQKYINKGFRGIPIGVVRKSGSTPAYVLLGTTGMVVAKRDITSAGKTPISYKEAYSDICSSNFDRTLLEKIILYNLCGGRIYRNNGGFFTKEPKVKANNSYYNHGHTNIILELCKSNMEIEDKIKAISIANGLYRRPRFANKFLLETSTKDDNMEVACLFADNIDYIFENGYYRPLMYSGW